MIFQHVLKDDMAVNHTESVTEGGRMVTKGVHGIFAVVEKERDFRVCVNREIKVPLEHHGPGLRRDGGGVGRAGCEEGNGALGL